MKIISDYSLEQLSEILTGFGEPKFRARQIFRAVHQGKRFKDMTDLKISLRERLEKEFVDNPCEIIEELIELQITQEIKTKEEATSYIKIKAAKANFNGTKN